MMAEPTSDEPYDIAEALRKRMEAMNIKRPELSELLGVSINKIHGLLRTDRKPSVPKGEAYNKVKRFAFYGLDNQEATEDEFNLLRDENLPNTNTLLTNYKYMDGSKREAFMKKRTKEALHYAVKRVSEYKRGCRIKGELIPVPEIELIFILAQSRYLSPDSEIPDFNIKMAIRALEAEQEDA